MQTNSDWTKKYYNEEAQKLIAERQKHWTPELQKQCERDWTKLLRDIEAAAAEGVDPASPRAQALAERHAKLIEGFTGGHPAIEEGLRRLWSDVGNWSAEAKEQVFQPLAREGITSAQDERPKLLGNRADTFLKKALATRASKG